MHQVKSLDGRKMSNNFPEQNTEQEIRRGEKIHIYISGIIWLAIILSVVGFIIYISVGFAMLD
jgi:hypothetical protein